MFLLSCLQQCACARVCVDEIENEYGSYRSVDCGHDYMSHLHDLARRYLGDEIVLFTTDGNSLDVLKCGTTNDTYATVDFGPTSGAQDCCCVHEMKA